MPSTVGLEWALMCNDTNKSPSYFLAKAFRFSNEMKWSVFRVKNNLYLGCLFAIYIDPIFDLVNTIAGGGVWDPETRLLSNLPAKLVLGDVLKAVVLSLFLSFTVTIFPARRAARLNPVEALRNE